MTVAKEITNVQVLNNSLMLRTNTPVLNYKLNLSSCTIVCLTTIAANIGITIFLHNPYLLVFQCLVQPLDIAVFKPLKTIMKRILFQRMVGNAIVSISKKMH
jgi:hypothetical protein